MYRKILVPIDLSHHETARRTIGTAKSLAVAGNAGLTLLTVIPDPPRYVTAELPSGILEQVRNRTQHELEVMAAATGLKGKCEVVVREGRPHNEILEVAAGIGCDLIIVASHQPGLQDYLLGSVAGKVVRHAKCSVLVERQREGLEGK